MYKLNTEGGSGAKDFCSLTKLKDKFLRSHKLLQSSFFMAAWVMLFSFPAGSLQAQCNDPMTLTVSCDPVLCYGDANGYAEGRIYGGTPPYTVTITGPMSATTTVNEYSGTFDFTGLIAGTYTVTAWDVNYDHKNNVGCKASGTALIGEPPPLEWEVNCAIDSLGIVSGMVTGGTAPYRVILQQTDEQRTVTVAKSGDSFTFEDLSAGNYTLTVRDANYLTNLGAGCVISRDLTVSSVSACPDSIWITTNPTPPEICRGDIITLIAQSTTNCTDCVYEWSTGHKGRWTTVCPDSTTTYSVQVMTPDSCLCIGTDSAMVTVVIKDTVFIEVQDTICAGQTYSFGGQELNTSGVYRDTLQNSAGCDSTVVLTLTVNPASNETLNEEICEGESYTLGSQVLTSTGSYTEVFTASNGCDSTVTVNLTVLPTYNDTFDRSICAGDSLMLGSRVLTSTGTYTEVFTASNGCDSTVTVNLTVLPTYNDTFDRSICAGDSLMLGSRVLTSTGTYTEVFTASNGCDSTVTVNLTVLPTYNDTFDRSICAGDSLMLGSRVLTSTGTYTEVFTASNGCDSTVTVNLTVLPTYNDTFDRSICAGDSLMLGSRVLTSTGTYTEVFTASNGCDSTVTVNLTVLPTYNDTFDRSICAGDSLMLGSRVLTSTGTYTEVFTASNGCDSTVTVNLTVLPTYNDTFDRSICAGDSLMLGSRVLTSTGTYTEVFTASNGCDSTVTVNLTVLDLIELVVRDTICEGDSYPFNGMLLTTADTYLDTLESDISCDTLLTLILEVTDTIEVVRRDTICEGEIYVFYDQLLTNPGTYEETLQAGMACDTLVTLILTVNPAPDATLSPMDTVLCDNPDSIQLTVTNNDPSQILTYSWSPTGAILTSPSTVSSVMVDLTAATSFSVYLTNQYDCRDTLMVDFPPQECPDSIWITSNLMPAVICQGDSITLTAQGCASCTYLWSTNVTGPSITVSPNATTTYSVQAMTTDGCPCDAEAEITIEVNERVIIEETATICDGEEYLFCGQIFTMAGTYELTRPSQVGCDTLCRLMLTVNPAPDATLSPMDTVLCDNPDSIQLTVTNNDPSQILTYSWSPTGAILTSPSTVSSVMVDLTAATSFSVYLTNQYDCRDTLMVDFPPQECPDSIWITSNLMPAVICQGDSITLTAQGCASCTYLWSTNVTGPSITVSPNATTTYSVQAMTTDGCPCDAEAEITIEVNERVIIEETATICDGEEYLFCGQIFTMAGTYELTRPSQVGCDTLCRLMLTVNPAPDATLSPMDTVLCDNPDSIQLTVINNDPSQTLTYNWSPAGAILTSPSNVASVTVDLTAATSFSVYLTNQYDCRDTLMVDFPPQECPDSIWITSNLMPAVICQGDSITLTAQGCASCTYLWSTNVTGPSITVSPNATTTYSVQAMTTDGCPCDAEAEITIEVNEREIIEETATICDGEEYLFCGQIFTMAGTYELTRPSQVGCDTLCRLMLTVNPAPDATLSPMDTVLCDNPDSIQLTVINNDPSQTLTYNWSPAGAILTSPSNVASVMVDLTAATSFSVYLTNQYDCRDTLMVDFPPQECPDSIWITSNPMPAVICQGDSITLTAQGCASCTYLWSTNATGPSITVSPNATTTYSVQAMTTDGCPCDAEAEITVEVNERVIIEETATICDGEEYLFCGQIFTMAGTYELTRPSQVGCDTLCRLMLTVNPAPDATLIPMDTVLCDNPDSIQLTVINNDPSQTLTYNWSPAGAILTSPSNVASVTVDLTAATSFSVYLTNQYDCRDTLMVDFPPQECPDSIWITSNLMPAVICQGDSITLTAQGCASCTYLWSTNATGPSITVSPNATTTYSVQAMTTDGCPCDAEAEITVEVNERVIIEEKDTICAGETYLFYGRPLTMSGTYQATLPAASGCDTLVNLMLTVNPAPDATLIPMDTVLCDNPDSIQLTVINNDPSQTLTYNWSPAGAILTSPSNVASVTVDLTAATSFSVYLTNQYDCRDTLMVDFPPQECPDSIWITSNPVPAVICQGDSITLTAQGCASCTYLWSTNATGPSITVSPNSTTTYSVQAMTTDGCPCDAEAEIRVEVNERVIIEEKDTICAGETYLFYGRPLTMSGTYDTTLITASGCDTMVTVVLTVNPIPDATLLPTDTVLCVIPDNFLLTVTNNDTTQTLSYEWAPDFAILSDPSDVPSVLVDLLESTTFSVYLTNQYDCRDTLTVNFPSVACPDNLTITSDPNPAVICPGESVTLSVESDCIDCTYEWTSPAGNTLTGASITVNPEETTTYSVVAITAEGCRCESGDEITVVVDCPCNTDGIFIPSAFTPNNDMVNDELCVRATSGTDTSELSMVLTIYNRWGEAVFTTDNFGDCWDGTYKGAALPEDVYVYTLLLTCPGEAPVQKIGDVILLR